MDIGIGAAGSINEKQRFARFAEELGYHSIWMPEGRSGDQFSILTACALATTRIRVGTNISSVFVRTAPLIAMSAATVDAFSDGRLILGLGTDHRNQVVYMHGRQFEKPIPRMVETVDIIRALLRDDAVSYDGDIFKIRRYDMHVHPVVRREIPIWIAAVNPKMLGVAGEISSGTILVNHTIESAKTAKAQFVEGAERAGKTAADVTMAAMIPVAVADDRAEARQQMRYRLTGMVTRNPRYIALKHRLGFGEEWERMLGILDEDGRDAAAKALSDDYLDAFTVCGTPDEARERIKLWVANGVDLPIIAGGFGSKEALAVTLALAPSNF